MNFHHEVKYYKKTLHMPSCVQLLRAVISSGTGQVADSKTCVFKAHVNIDCFKFLRIYFFNKAAMWWCRNHPIQCWKENAVVCSKPPTSETCKGSIRHLININAEYLWHKRACHESETYP